jgi:ATP-dependent RNA helicase DHX29
LFDEWEAETRWPAIRNQLAQDQAAKRQYEIRPTNDQQEEAASRPVLPTKPVVEATTNGAESSGSEDEADILGEMFSAIPDQPAPSQVRSETSVSDNIALRDFGKSSGLTPRRLLEEAIRSRYVSLTSSSQTN